MKVSKKCTQSKTHAIPLIQFQDQSLTSYAGVSLLQLLFKRLSIRNRLDSCFRHLDNGYAYGYSLVMMWLIVHLFLGYRKLQDIQYYDNDPMVLRLLGLTRLPDRSTLCRRLATMDEQSVLHLRRVNRQIVLERLVDQSIGRITLDLDGSVLSTSRYAEGTAVGYNNKKKGQRSYYPLYCTVAQTGQVLDVWHRPGNVHDSNGALAFILDCISSIRTKFPGVIIEVRMDSAFFSEAIVDALDRQGVDFSISVPFARYTQLKAMIERRRRWQSLDSDVSWFETRWKPKCWGDRYRFLLLREWRKCQSKGPLQLDLFTPIDYQHDYQVIVTNKSMSAKKVVRYHNGRGYQENLFAELKSRVQMDYVPTRRLHGNQVFMLSTLMAHNLNREMQMIVHAPTRNTTEKRAPLWVFQKMDTIRQNFLQRAGRLTTPKGQLTLTMNASPNLEKEFMQYMVALAT